MAPIRDHGAKPGSGKRPAAEALAENLRRVRERIASAAARVGRDPQDTRLVAVTKTVPTAIIRCLLDLEMADFGENRIQAADQKILELGSGPCWHLIGHLQGNKARRAAKLFPWIHAVDSASLFDRLERASEEQGLRPSVLFQVNVSGEESKFGVSVEQLGPLLERAARARALEPVGLMTMAPLSADPEDARPHFRTLRALLEEERATGRQGPGFRHLSMGMTNDFEVAVEEGATLVRIGTALYQGLEID
ncbi:MAG: YggS family pyridoxal phosphate-dependent enzyme [Planctomycetota bacterium]